MKAGKACKAATEVGTFHTGRTPGISAPEEVQAAVREDAGRDLLIGKSPCFI